MKRCCNEMKSGMETCPHRDRQQMVISILREREGGVMSILGLLDHLTSEEVGFSEGQAIQALNDDPPAQLDINRATGLVHLVEPDTTS